MFPLTMPGMPTTFIERADMLPGEEDVYEGILGAIKLVNKVGSKERHEDPTGAKTIRRSFTAEATL